MRSSDWSSDVCSSDLKEKGNAARYHFGARAQRVWSICAEEGLVGAIKKSGPGAAPFAFLCYDKWKDKKEPEMVDVEIPVVIGDDGEEQQPARTERRATGKRRSEEHTSELQSLMRNSYAVFCLKKKKLQQQNE